MTDHKDSLSGLRKLAEQRLRAHQQDPLTVPSDQLPQLAHELQVYQIELEMQNEELRRSHHELEAAHHRYTDLFELAPLGYLILDERGRVIQINLVGAQLLGVERAGLVGNRLHHFVADAYRDAFHLHLRGAFRSGIGVNSELEMRRADGSCFFARLDSAVHTAGQPGYMQCLTALSDISEQKRAATMIQAARETSERASDAKTRFLAAASHDIRQPLQALTTFNDLLRRRLREPKNLELLECQTEALAGMRDLLDALLDVSRLDSGAITPEIQSFPVAPLLRRLETHYQPLARNKGLTLRVARCSAVIASDPVLLRQILDNLVANAIRYTAEGKVLVGCRRRGGALRFEVWDTGIGIAEDEQARIFEDFYQLDNPARNANKGLGLGLAIVERTARLLGHRVDLKSWDKGTLFTMALPVAEPGSGTNENPPAENPVPAGIPAMATVLLVEDNDIVRDSMVMMLNSYGYRVIAATDGAQALARTSGEAPRPNIIVTDYRLPEGETGPQAIEAVCNALGADIPALILTGDIELADSPEALGISCTILHKPLDPATLNEHIRRLLS